jgi:hypothetical protein
MAPSVNLTPRQKSWLLLAGGMALVAAGQRVIRAQADSLGLSKPQLMGINASAGLAQRVLL